ncbi:hypothetical protein V8C86DRAFT_859434 [Haematococcus lacustris]
MQGAGWGSLGPRPHLSRAGYAAAEQGLQLGVRVKQLAAAVIGLPSCVSLDSLLGTPSLEAVIPNGAAGTVQSAEPTTAQGFPRSHRRAARNQSSSAQRGSDSAPQLSPCEQSPAPAHLSQGAGAQHRQETDTKFWSDSCQCPQSNHSSSNLTLHILAATSLASLSAVVAQYSPSLHPEHVSSALVQAARLLSLTVPDPPLTPPNPNLPNTRPLPYPTTSPTVTSPCSPSPHSNTSSTNHSSSTPCANSTAQGERTAGQELMVQLLHLLHQPSVVQSLQPQQLGACMWALGVCWSHQAAWCSGPRQGSRTWARPRCRLALNTARQWRQRQGQLGRQGQGQGQGQGQQPCLAPPAARAACRSAGQLLLGCLRERLPQCTGYDLSSSLWGAAQMGLQPGGRWVPRSGLPAAAAPVPRKGHGRA